MALKRDPANSHAQERRQSFADTQKQGFFAKMWHDYTRGSGPMEKK